MIDVTHPKAEGFLNWEYMIEAENMVLHKKITPPDSVNEIAFSKLFKKYYILEELLATVWPENLINRKKI